LFEQHINTHIFIILLIYPCIRTKSDAIWLLAFGSLCAFLYFYTVPSWNFICIIKYWIQFNSIHSELNWIELNWVELTLLVLLYLTDIMPIIVFCVQAVMFCFVVSRRKRYTIILVVTVVLCLCLIAIGLGVGLGVNGHTGRSRAGLTID